MDNVQRLSGIFPDDKMFLGIYSSSSIDIGLAMTVKILK